MKIDIYHLYSMLPKFFSKYFPPNYTYRNPFKGSLLLFCYCYLFATIYQPLRITRSQNFDISFELTMLIYILSASISCYIIILICRQTPFFRNTEKWNIGKEIVFVLICLSSMILCVYFLGFIIDNSPSGRWNLYTFLDSSKKVILVGSIPFLYFSIKNIRQIIPSKSHNTLKTEHKIQIRSKLKKESLSFSEKEFLYAKSDGNYIEFYLYRSDKIKIIQLRNTITDIENQLTDYPDLFKTHRAFIVNLKQIEKKSGNAQGYLLKIKHSDEQIPVSRSKISSFNALFSENEI